MATSRDLLKEANERAARVSEEARQRQVEAEEARSKRATALQEAIKPKTLPAPVIPRPMKRDERAREIPSSIIQTQMAAMTNATLRAKMETRAFEENRSEIVETSEPQERSELRVGRITFTPPIDRRVQREINRLDEAMATGSSAEVPRRRISMAEEEGGGGYTLDYCIVGNQQVTIPTRTTNFLQILFGSSPSVSWVAVMPATQPSNGVVIEVNKHRLYFTGEFGNG